MKEAFLFLVLLSLSLSLTDIQSDTWTATDNLGRTLPTNSEVGNPRNNKTVGIFYFLWLTQNAGPYDISKYMDAAKGNFSAVKFGPSPAFHYWSKPHFDYYRSNDEWVIRKHATQLTNAGIDVVIFDVSNGEIYNSTLFTLLKTYRKMRDEGSVTPQISFLLYTRSNQTLLQLWDNLFKAKNYQELWYRWDGKPLILMDSTQAEPYLLSQFTFRYSWAWSRSAWFGDGKGKWTWLDDYPQKAGLSLNGTVEQVSVCAAQHPTTSKGRSAKASCNCETLPIPFNQTESGPYFQSQWDRALQVDPSFVFVTGWNEWMAQLSFQASATKFAGMNVNAGDPYFVDCFNTEFSRDLEPMSGGFGDNYYYQLALNVRKYKGVREVPMGTVSKTISIGTDFSQWSDVGPTFMDDQYDAILRNFTRFGSGNVRLLDSSKRNDLIEAKMARDTENLYAYVASREDWFGGNIKYNWLFIDSDANPSTGWMGFDFLVDPYNKSIQSNVDNQFKWKPKASITDLVFQGKEMHVSLPLQIFNLSSSLPFKIQFKWFSSEKLISDPMDFMTVGDSAPNGRFTYLYRSPEAHLSSHSELPSSSGELSSLLNEQAGKTNNIGGSLKVGFSLVLISFLLVVSAL